MPLLAPFPTAVVYDAARRLGVGSVARGLFAVAPGARMLGPAATARYVPKDGIKPKPSLTLYDVIAAAPHGSVLVVEFGQHHWIAGSNIASFAQQHHLQGMLIDGGIRDTAELRALGFAVYSRGPAIEGYGVDAMLGETGGCVVCGGAAVEPGDCIIGDDDGALVIPAADVAAVAYQAEDILSIDEAQAAGIRSGLPLDRLKENMARWNIRRT